MDGRAYTELVSEPSLNPNVRGIAWGLLEDLDLHRRCVALLGTVALGGSPPTLAQRTHWCLHNT